MSFWGGFVEGFATELKKGVDKAVDTDAEIIKDTVKIGVNKYLENEQEIKTETNNQCRNFLQQHKILGGVSFSFSIFLIFIII